MIELPAEVDLGRDLERMRDTADANRQRATVRHILSRFFHEHPQARCEVQLLADEVGMGKTFVALAVAYAILAAMRGGYAPDDLAGARRRVLILTPVNEALMSKWRKEVSEFVRRCVDPAVSGEVARWFQPTPVSSIDDLIRESRSRRSDSQILVGKLSLLSRQPDTRVRQKLILSTLFRRWGNGFTFDRRERLLQANDLGWSRDPSQLMPTVEELEGLSVDSNDIMNALDRTKDGEVRRLEDDLRSACREITESFVRNRPQRLRDEVLPNLNKLYRQLAPDLLSADWPLVIVDEAHVWRGQRHGYDQFVQTVAPHTRRLLLLTATPFQIRPEEIRSVLQVAGKIRPCPAVRAADARQQALGSALDEVVGPVVRSAAAQSQAFGRAWMNLPRPFWNSVAETWANLAAARVALRKMAHEPSALTTEQIDSVIEPFLDLDPAIKTFYREALRLYARNADLSAELGRFVVRHRRTTDHRLYLVGRNYAERTKVPLDHRGSVLHDEYGMPVSGAAELPLYLLMRCISQMKEGRGRASLGSALTGCYSTLTESADGVALKAAVDKNDALRARFDVLTQLTGRDADPSHPKMQAVVRSALHAWDDGEKTLIFCFRLNNAERLKDILAGEIERRMSLKLEKIGVSQDWLRTLRGRFTGRDRDLFMLGADRVLWSFWWANGGPAGAMGGIAADDFRLQEGDLRGLAELSLQFGVPLDAERVDRVFLCRATEHVIARRLLARSIGGALWQPVLRRVADQAWIRFAYGEIGAAAEADDENLAGFDGRGITTAFEPKAEPVAAADAERLTAALEERRAHARRQGDIPIIDAYAEAPNLWLGSAPSGTDLRSVPRSPVVGMHEALWRVSSGKDVAFGRTRLRVIEALRRAVSWDAVLHRLVPEGPLSEGDGWARSLAQSFHADLRGQSESLFDRFSIFVQDVASASGSVDDPKSARGAYVQVSRLHGQGPVALVTGETDADTRERLFSAFNSPLPPDILVCTSVGAEGIDLHRHCRQVVHFDLAWNPATLEQRTGRVDRIGSKAFRERAATAETDLTRLPRLEIGVPYLAGTYDERMFAQLCLRAQTFEVLTGGALATAIPEDDEESDDEGELDLPARELPPQMIADLRVRLHVWSVES